ncbi:MAG: LysM peptidoglycan-binding domain-containing protein [Actinomycetota bacterium]
MATKLTARGRSVVRGTVVASLLIVIGAGFSAVGNATENKAVGVSGTSGYTQVVVAPGETLWSLASMVAGSGSVTAVEQEIVDANQLVGTDLAAGARLWVPVK